MLDFSTLVTRGENAGLVKQSPKPHELFSSVHRLPLTPQLVAAALDRCQILPVSVTNKLACSVECGTQPGNLKRIAAPASSLYICGSSGLSKQSLSRHSSPRQAPPSCPRQVKVGAGQVEDGAL
ncbi:hypothetical protein RRG08_022520 [Elysia crispata]|uniref:Uncharacterized protein n=1 Tax=Elysia crispata TaxID=231223 RepID=A0AAE1D8E2_9GAST|nr:hypothetical protein RRG08_022520 [Elysia crispata]